jgi:hypothetical protein
MFGYESVTAGVTGPEVADEVLVQVGGRFGGHHGIGTDSASRQITSTRVGARRDGRQDFSNCWHRDLLCGLTLAHWIWAERLTLTNLYTEFFEDVATQMRCF